MMTFSLTQEQLERADQWIESRPKRDQGAIGGRWTYRFTPTSIGLCVCLIDNDTKEEIDLTEYESF